VSWRVLVRPRAENDLQRAWEWYEREQPGLGDDFLAEMRQLIRSLEQFPERSVVYYRGFRRLLGERFPHKVFYRIESDLVIIFRVLHAKQDHRSRLK
jgi:plasmid stabilization system protein ParE